MKQGIEELIAAERWSYRGNRLFKGELCLATLTYPNDVLVAVKENNRSLDRIAAALREPGTEPKDDRAHMETIQERDALEDRLTILAEAVGSYFEVPVGEWSSANDPDKEALKILNGEYKTKFDATEQIPLTVEQARATLTRYISPSIVIGDDLVRGFLAALRMEHWKREAESYKPAWDAMKAELATQKQELIDKQAVFNRCEAALWEMRQERDALKREVERLQGCLNDANCSLSETDNLQVYNKKLKARLEKMCAPVSDEELRTHALHSLRLGPLYGPLIEAPVLPKAQIDALIAARMKK